MSGYHDYLPLVKHYLSRTLQAPRVLEVGINPGTMFVPLAAHMARSYTKFMLMGIDVNVDESLKLMLQHLDFTEPQITIAIEGFSQDVMSDMVDQGMCYDVVLLDSDRQYDTCHGCLSHELGTLNRLTHPGSIVVISEYESNSYVKQATNEWLMANPAWKLSAPISGGTVMLTRRLQARV